MNFRIRRAALCPLLAAIAAAAALLFPWDRLLEFLASRFNTIRAARPDFEKGFLLLRGALLLNAALLAAWPHLLRRLALAPGGPPLVSRDDLVPAALLGLAAMAASAPGLGLSFQDDEWRAFEVYVRHGPFVILTRNLEGDNHLLYSLLAWPFAAALGFTEFAARAPAFFLGAPAPPLLYLLLRRRHPRPAAFLAALPLAAFPFLVGYSAEGRAYAPLFSTFLLLALLQRPALEGSRRAWAAYAAAATAAPALHIFGAAGVVALAAGAFADPSFRGPAPRARNLAALALAGSGSVLLYAFHWAPLAGASSTFRPSGPALPAFQELFPGLAAAPLTPLLLVPFAAAAAWGAARGTTGRAIPAATLAAFVLQWIVGQLAGPGQGIRFFTPALAFAAVLVGEGLAAALARPALGGALAGTILAVSLGADVDALRTGKRDYRTAAADLGARRRPGETLGLLFDGRPLAHYLGESVPILAADEVAARRPDWFVAVDVNIPPDSALRRWIDAECELVFRHPSFRGTILGYRRR
jgi:hypothetical protein